MGSPSRPCAVKQKVWTNTLGQPVLKAMSLGYLINGPMCAHFWPAGYARQQNAPALTGRPGRGASTLLEWVAEIPPAQRPGGRTVVLSYPQQ